MEEDDNEKKRYNVLINMSRYIANQKVLDCSIFSKEVYKDFVSYPKTSVQKNNTSGLWNYGIIEYIFSNDIYQNPQRIIISMIGNKFLIDVINTWSKIICGNNMIDNKEIENAKIIDLDGRIFKNILGNDFSFSKEIIIEIFLRFCNPFYRYWFKYVVFYKRNFLRFLRILSLPFFIFFSP